MKTYDEIAQQVNRAAAERRRRMQHIRYASASFAACIVCMLGLSVYLRLGKPETVPAETSTETIAAAATEPAQPENSEDAVPIPESTPAAATAPATIYTAETEMPPADTDAAGTASTVPVQTARPVHTMPAAVTEVPMTGASANTDVHPAVRTETAPPETDDNSGTEAADPSGQENHAETLPEPTTEYENEVSTEEKLIEDIIPPDFTTESTTETTESMTAPATETTTVPETAWDRRAIRQYDPAAYREI